MLELGLVLPQLFIFVLGLLIGSFLNVVIGRLPAGESIVRPRSRCPKCGHMLSWYENIPVLSWLFLRARCKSCRASISWRYPAVEMLTGLLFWFCARRFELDWQLVSALMLVTLLVPLAFIDLEHWILPFELTLPGIVLGVLIAIPMGFDRVRDAAIGITVGFFAFWALEWIGRKIFKQEALGGGDKYLLALLGGFLSWRALLGVIFFSSFQGALVGLAMRAFTGRAGPALIPQPAQKPSPEGANNDDEDDWVPGPSNIPFGPWLAVAGLEILLLGPWLSRLLPWPLGSFLTGIGSAGP